MVNKTSTLVACLDELAPRYVIGSDPFDVERLAWNIQRAEYGRAGEIAQSALASFDVACWDLIGQSLNVPIWKLICGKFRDRVPAYANGWYQAEREPRAIASLAGLVVDRGYRALKLDPFGAASAELPTPQRRRAVEIVAAVREAVGPDVQILIERCTDGSRRRPRSRWPRCSSRTSRTGSRNRCRRRIPGRSRASAPRRVYRSRQGSARTRPKTSARSSKAGSWTWCRSISRTSADCLR